MIKISRMADKSDTYKGFSSDISLFFQRIYSDSLNKEWNITTKPF